VLGKYPMLRKSWKTVAILGLAILLLLALSIYLQLELPAPTGPDPVGQTVFRWVDASRPEVMTNDPNDLREVVAMIWYPAELGTGSKSPYFPELASVSKALAERGEIEAWQVCGLPYVRSRNLWDAKPARSDAPYPILIFSPGNATNIEFYSSLAREIASHGYVVVGLNHPYDVAAVELSNHKIAGYDKAQDSMERSAHAAFIAERINVRTQDMLFVLNRLESLNSNGPFVGLLDLKSVAVGGHSLGGITASEACKADVRVRACLNLDGIQRGGPFSTEESAIPPDQPFLFLTKEPQLPPKLIEQFESMKQSYWVVIHEASHDSFTDGPLLQPSLLPIPNHADQMISLIRKYTLAFLDQTLKGQQSDLLSKSIQLEEVTVKVYPSS